MLPRATLKAPFSLGTRVSLTLSSTSSWILEPVLTTQYALNTTQYDSRKQTPGRTSRGVKKHLSHPAPIWVLFHDLRCSRPQISAAHSRSVPRQRPSHTRPLPGGVSWTSPTPAPLFLFLDVFSSGAPRLSSSVALGLCDSGRSSKCSTVCHSLHCGASHRSTEVPSVVAPGPSPHPP